MPDDIRVKICGLRKPVHVHAAVTAGAAYVGFVFYSKSPRHLTTSEAFELAVDVPPGVAKVALMVNAPDEMIEDIVETVPLDMLQLHGTETAERVAEIRELYRLPVMKAVGIADETDLPALAEFGRVADQLLVDAKPPNGSGLPGGNGLAFDWRLIAGRRWPVPWMLAGGLTAGNVAEAIRLTGARQVDVSSGVETAPGVKDAELIGSFIAAAKA